YKYKFFFSSRRWHTRFSRDWSSDVCSSDLLRRVRAAHTRLAELEQRSEERVRWSTELEAARRAATVAELVAEAEAGEEQYDREVAEEEAAARICRELGFTELDLAVAELRDR